MSQVKIVAWGEGDRTVGDGTLNATLVADLQEDDVKFVKDELRKVFSQVWDLQERRVHVMTQEEFDEYTSDH